MNTHQEGGRGTRELSRTVKREKKDIQTRGVATEMVRQAAREGKGRRRAKGREEDSKRRGTGIRWRDVKLRHGAPGLATGESHLQRNLGKITHTYTQRGKGEGISVC